MPIAAVSILGLTPSVFADINVHTLRVSHNSTYVLTETALPMPKWRGGWNKSGPLFNFQLNTISEPLVRYSEFDNSKTVLVHRLTSLDLGAQVYLTQKWLVAIDLPMAVVRQPDKTRFGMGDLRFFNKVHVYHSPTLFSVTLNPEIYLPTGSKPAHLSDGGLGYGLGLGIERDFQIFRLALNAYYRGFPKAQFSTVDYSSQLAFGAGASIPAGRFFSFLVEGSSSFLLSQSNIDGPGDLYIGTAYRAFEGGRIHAGVSFGRVDLEGNANMRIVAGLKMFPKDEEASDAPMANCGDRMVNPIFNARPLTPEEMASSEIKKNLPYKVTGKEKLTLLNLGESTAKAGEVPHVLGGLTLFAIDLENLPSKNAIRDVKEASFKTKVSRVMKPGKHAETLCFLKQRFCSGENASNKFEKARVNAAFFAGKETPNDFFAVMDFGPVVGQAGKFKVRSIDASIPLERLIQNSKYIDQLALIYEGVPPNEPILKKTIYFGVSDDTFVSGEKGDTRLVLRITEDTCRRPGAKQAAKR